MEDRIAAAVQQAVGEDAPGMAQLPCAAAFKIAQQLGAEPIEVGQAADRNNVRLGRCQLGLFGYGPKSEGKHRIVKPMAQVPNDLRQAIQESLTDGRLTCAAAWSLAERFGRPRLDISSAAEGMGIRISHCQLGAF